MTFIICLLIDIAISALAWGTTFLLTSSVLGSWVVAAVVFIFVGILMLTGGRSAGIVDDLDFGDLDFGD